LRPGPAGLQHVAGALLLPFPDELRHCRPGGAALRRGPGSNLAGRAGLGVLLLSPGDLVAAAAGTAVPGRGPAPVPLRRLPPGALAEGPGAVGPAHGPAVRGGCVDTLSADADARHPLKNDG